MEYYLEDAEYRGAFRFWLRFNTGEEGVVNLESVLTNAPRQLGEQFRKDPNTVKNFYLDPWPTLAWACGYDIAPERLYELFMEQNARQVADDKAPYNTD